MSEDQVQGKREKIRKLLEMQRKFIALDREQGIDMRDYFAPAEDHPLHDYRNEQLALAMDIVDSAHAVKGSRRD